MNGISTVCLTSALDITASVHPPRAAFLDFPLGHTAGKALEPELQLSVVRDALMTIEEMTTPGGVKILPYRWSQDDSWQTQEPVADTRQERSAEPQFQTAADRIAYERRCLQ